MSVRLFCFFLATGLHISHQEVTAMELQSKAVKTHDARKEVCEIVLLDSGRFVRSKLGTAA